MSASRVYQLIAGHPSAEVQARDKPPLLQKVQDPIDARPSHATLTGPKPIFDVQRTECARLARKEVDHRVARGASVMSCLIEHSTGVLSPLRTTGDRHSPRF